MSRTAWPSFRFTHNHYQSSHRHNFFSYRRGIDLHPTYISTCSGSADCER